VSATRRLLGELADSLALVARYTAGSQDVFLRKRQGRGRHPAAAARDRTRLCPDVGETQGTPPPGVPWRALTGLPGIVGHGPYPAWEISRNHLTQLRAVIDTETPPAGDR
jgi:hypothetical protein